MKCVLFSAALCICFLAATQAPGRGRSSQAAPVPSMASTADAEVSVIEKDFVGLADAMPEDKYNFAPSNGEFKGVRTFAEQVKHVATVNNLFWSTALNEKPTVELTKSMNGPDSIRSKARSFSSSRIPSRWGIARRRR